VAMLVGGRLIERVDARWVLLVGILFMLSALTMLSDLNLDVTISYLTIARGLQGIGTGFLFISVAAAAYSTLPAKQMGHATGLYNLIRNEASSVGIATASTLLARRTQFHLARLTPDINPYNPLFRERMAHFVHLFSAHSGVSPGQDRTLAMAGIVRRLERQAVTMSYLDVFWVMTLVLLCFLPLVPILQGKVRGRAAPVGE
jgi:DHA2 family multidrug resistance protein